MSDPQHIPLLPAEMLEREQRRRNSPWPGLWSTLDAVMDPEIPVISIWELGILQDVELNDGLVTVTITPTYSGCPAMHTIAEDIGIELKRCGYAQCQIVTQLAPAWSTSWMSTHAQEKLREYGIAPPQCADREGGITCPHCGSEQVQAISEFGSTACKALYKCNACAEPFDYFKSF